MTKEDFLQKTNEINFSWIIKKITQRDPNVARIWTKEGAEDAIAQYKKFTYLLFKYHGLKGKKLVPSIEVDEIWHHHILDTRSYEKDCINLYGYFMHHFPYFGMRGDDDFKDLNESFSKTQELYFEEFGEYMYEVDF
ncbi:glycine-rich domain-containing protein [Photorhabdus luminescens]|uniref:glycine-rich domain-containing protein n=1 Tax=Photorhabdus luminescens TaxID=29488 RepID=UPI00223F62C0|nr:glycine-rich domain-containing protein-like [Photorhabdus luminescens]MCW7763958.1 glycine-rich domain-containing protein-like [Photorhabdus luminescens subsp. venezuelensis]